MSQKMQWTQPQLIVLAKGMPEESVLDACKYIGAPLGIGPEAIAQQGCATDTENCAACQNRGSQT
jgi:hypothetical protein